jgi:hypothetical protein
MKFIYVFNNFGLKGLTRIFFKFNLIKEIIKFFLKILSGLEVFQLRDEF